MSDYISELRRRNLEHAKQVMAERDALIRLEHDRRRREEAAAEAEKERRDKGSAR
jgi:hypothetical protein